MVHLFLMVEVTFRNIYIVLSVHKHKATFSVPLEALWSPTTFMFREIELMLIVHHSGKASLVWFGHC